MGDDVTVQLGMFGVGNRIAGTHVVQAHTRVLANGNEVFVGEHLRWNGGGGARSGSPRPRRSSSDDPTQQELFAGPDAAR